jgi:hypothetical protein
MGIEFACSLATPPSETVVSDVLDRLGSDPALEVIDRGPSRAALRFASGARRSDWPEDLIVEISDQQVYVVFYAAGRPERAQFLSRLSELLASHNIRCDFEEL